jgi:conjugative relaxase-like TrwC/TraI family protein
MLSIAKMPSANYFKQRDGVLYYVNKGELPGVWFGRGAERVGLTGPIKEADFVKVHQGFAPDRAKLVRNAGTRSHFPGHDATNSAPKTVSVLWATHRDPKARAEIEHAVAEANKDSLRLYEKTGIFARLGPGGVIVEQAVGLIAGTFLHTTSRVREPQLHVHNTIFTPVLCRDGGFRAILGITARKDQRHVKSRSALYQMKLVLGAAFQDSLARRIEALGYPIERTKNGFEVVGIPRELVERFSTRSKDIAKDMERRGVSGAREAARSAVLTRPAKQAVSLEVLLRRWQEAARGFDPTRLRRRTASLAVVPAAPGRVDPEHSEERDQASPGRTRGPREAPPAHSVARSPAAAENHPPAAAVLSPKERDASDIRPYVRAADRVRQILKRSQRNGAHRLAPGNVWLAVQQVEFLRHATLTRQDRAALAHITRRRGSIQLLATAGAGRVEPILAAARLAWQREGYKVLLATTTHAAAQHAQKQTGIHAVTVNGLMSGLTQNRGLIRGYLSAHQKALSILGFRKKGSFVKYALKASGKWLSLDEKTVLIVDTPGALSLPELSALLKRVHAAGAKLVLVEEATERSSRREPRDSVAGLFSIALPGEHDHPLHDHEPERSH